jgi:hypothetical protein
MQQNKKKLMNQSINNYIFVFNFIYYDFFILFIFSFCIFNSICISQRKLRNSALLFIENVVLKVTNLHLNNKLCYFLN